MDGTDSKQAPQASLERLLSIAEVSELLCISESGVYRLIRRGELVTVKVGGRTLFEQAVIRQFIAASRREKQAAALDRDSMNREAA